MMKQTIRPRTKPSEVRRQELMDAAATLFIEQGIEATTIESITSRADVAKGTFYHYFSTKNEILEALRTAFSEGFLDRVGAAVETCPAGDHVARLKQWLISGVSIYLAEYKLHDVVFHQHGRRMRYRAEKNAVVGQLADLLAAGARDGAWTVQDIEFVSVVVYQGFHGAVDDAIENGAQDPKPVADALFALFSSMLRK
ncbi:TetR/AcrR family transcriptional regulator [Phyllobacterium myrsinacearum]|uniref:AcrR family transcriptional regulator n=1 Tax=Phyllobacterium myrsinacearum TaxID=28101 RepID=A0A839ETD4_9HYPH|nr:TetR/AcrR family transcriptional regulator [Phyllobacterium myrsinacearum]MBA8879850.1 AcrR family transcriptional regulator [Phyllobacterium myrsinacearum]